MKEYIIEFCEQYNYPPDAIKAFVNAYSAITANDTAFILLNKNISKFNNNSFTNGDEVLVLLDEIASTVNIHKYTIHLLFYIILSQELKQKYIKNKIPLDIFYTTMNDLKWL